MKVLLYPICHVTPHFETELEIAQTHLEKGDTVFFLVCKGELQTCLSNPEHIKSICIKCNSTINKGIQLLKNKNVTILDYPKIKIDYSKIPCNFLDIEELKKYTIDDSIEIGLNAASSLISLYNMEHKLNTKDFKNEIYVELCTAFYLYKIFDTYIFQKIKPDLIYIFNGRSTTSGPIVSLCKRINQPFFVHERGGQMGKYYLANNSTPHDISYAQKEIENLWIEGENSKYETGSRFYIDRRNRIVQGWYSFTKNQEKNSLPESFSKNRKNIAIFNSSIGEYAAVKGWENAIYIFGSEIDALKSILTFFKKNDSKIHFYLRVHPNLKGCNNSQTNDIYSLEKEFKNIEIIKPESNIDTYTLLENADIILVWGSTVGIEAVFWGKPVIQLGLSFYNNLNAVYIPESFDQLVEMINSDLKPKNTLGAIKYGYWELTRGTNYKYFSQENIYEGKFLNTRIQSSKLKYYFYLFFEIWTWKDIKRILRKIFLKRVGTS